MDRNYLICIESVIEQDGEQDSIQLMTHGSFLRRGGSYFITYEETETTGYAGCTTTIRASRDEHRVAMLRYGPVANQLVIERGIRHVCHYDTGAGAISLGVMADEIRCELGDTGGTLVFGYTLDCDTRELSRNRVTITVKPL